MKKFTILFEENDVASTAIFDNLSTAYKMPLLNYIGGFEIEVEKLDTVFKLSQDRNEKSYLNIIKKLSEKSGDANQIAKEMEKRLSQLFHHEIN